MCEPAFDIFWEGGLQQPSELILGQLVIRRLEDLNDSRYAKTNLQRRG